MDDAYLWITGDEKGMKYRRRIGSGGFGDVHELSNSLDQVRLLFCFLPTFSLLPVKLYVAGVVLNDLISKRKPVMCLN